MAFGVGHREIHFGRFARTIHRLRQLACDVQARSRIDIDQPGTTAIFPASDDHIGIQLEHPNQIGGRQRVVGLKFFSGMDLVSTVWPS